VNALQRCREPFAALSLRWFQHCTARAARAQRRSATRRRAAVMRARRPFGSRDSTLGARFPGRRAPVASAGEMDARALRERDTARASRELLSRTSAPVWQLRVWQLRVWQLRVWQLRVLHHCCIRSARGEDRPRAARVETATPRSTPNSYIDIPKSTSNTAAAPSGCRWLGFALRAAKPLQKAAVCGETSHATKVTAVLARMQLATFPHRVFVKISDRGAFDKPHATTTRRTSTHRSSTGIKSRAHGFTRRAALLHHGSARMLHIARMLQP
jgi:hypothetical protein